MWCSVSNLVAFRLLKTVPEKRFILEVRGLFHDIRDRDRAQEVQWQQYLHALAQQAQAGDTWTREELDSIRRSNYLAEQISQKTHQPKYFF